MKSFRETLALAEPEVGIPIMVEEFDKWGKDIKVYLESVWHNIADRVLKEYATKLYIDTLRCSPIEQKLYFALHSHFIDNLMNYQGTTCLLVNKTTSEISKFLDSQRQKPFFKVGDVDYEIDIFLYLDCFLIESKYGRMRVPFYIGIECDGHDFHERTKWQAQKDRSKDRMLKIQGLDIIRFTGSEITRSPENCVSQIQCLIDSKFDQIEAVLNSQP